jgi:hypothetical protein
MPLYQDNITVTADRVPNIYEVSQAAKDAKSLDRQIGEPKNARKTNSIRKRKPAIVYQQAQYLCACLQNV